jgi:acyl transferase domain-containing protein
MEPMLDDFREVAGSLSFERPRIPIVSNVAGGPVSDEVTSPDYWARHVRGTVRFLDGVRFLEGEGVTRFLELGPDGVLSGMARQCLTPGDGDEPLLVATLRRRKPEPEALIRFLAAAHVHGAEVDFEALLLPYGPAAALP